MIVYVKHIDTPLGSMYGGTTDQGICFIEFIDRVKLDAELARLSKELDATLEPGEHPFLVQLEEELKEYFEKKRTQFNVPLHLTGTEFQKSVWNSLLEIPYGKTCTYKQQAVQLGQLPAIRAIAATNGQNKHAIVIPCHRVIGSDGNLTGYAAGLSKKAWLLDFEMDRKTRAPEFDFGD
jgi:AraC family transcriptional regulator of adaptative response/methylated-DNA-[protein]-cysteine methyltransferase